MQSWVTRHHLHRVGQNSLNCYLPALLLAGVPEIKGEPEKGFYNMPVHYEKARFCREDNAVPYSRRSHQANKFEARSATPCDRGVRLWESAYVARA
jgi:hypothetical protein